MGLSSITNCHPQGSLYEAPLFFAKQNIVYLVKKICNGISYKILSYKKNEKSVAEAIDFSF